MNYLIFFSGIFLGAFIALLIISICTMAGNDPHEKFLKEREMKTKIKLWDERL